MTACGQKDRGLFAMLLASGLLVAPAPADGHAPEARRNAPSAEPAKPRFGIFELSAAGFVQTRVFQQGMDGYHTFRIPALIQATDGTLLAFAEGRRTHWRDHGDIDLVLRRSPDMGRTWGPLQVVWNDGPNTCGNPTVALDGTTGRLWLFMTHNSGADSQRMIMQGTSRGVRTIWSTFSDDRGRTWSPPVNRFRELQAPDTRWDATGPGNGIQLRHGPHAGRLVIPANGRNLQSDDHGRTWHQGSRLPDGTSEATLIELDDAELLRNSRATGSLRDVRRRIISRSGDHGLAWSPHAAHAQLPCPICHASMITHREPRAAAEWVVFANPARHEPDDRTTHDRRLDMTVRLSASRGVSFEHSRLVFAGDAAYSSLASLRDGTIGLLYENGDDWPYRRITFARFTTDWIRVGGLPGDVHPPAKRFSQKRVSCFERR